MRTGALPHDDRAQQRAHLEVVRQVAATSTTLAHERTLPVADALTQMVPSGQLQRGSTLAVHGVGATSMALALAGEAIRSGSFLAIVAPHSFGLAACLDFAIPLRRVVQFVLPSGRDSGAPLAAIIEGFDVVLLVDDMHVSTSAARQLTARNRERGSVLIRVGGRPWPDAADLRFDIGDVGWQGLGQGHGHLQSRQVSVQVAGRRYHGKKRSHQLMLPAIAGGIEAIVEPVRESASHHFAGSDIDAFLDAVETDSTSAEGDLDAIA